MAQGSFTTGQSRPLWRRFPACSPADSRRRPAGVSDVHSSTRHGPVEPIHDLTARCSRCRRSGPLARGMRPRSGAPRTSSTSSCSTDRPRRAPRSGGWRRVRDDSSRPARRSRCRTSRRATTRVFNVFGQDEITVGRRSRSPSAQSSNTTVSTDGELLPSARVMWNVTPATTRAWAAVSRARRTPSPQNWACASTVVATPGRRRRTAASLALVGNPEFQTEQLTEIEGGYRIQIGSSAALDVAVFRGSYDHLATMEPIAPVFQGLAGTAPAGAGAIRQPSQCRHRRFRGRRALGAGAAGGGWMARIPDFTWRPGPIRPAKTRPRPGSTAMRPSTSGNCTRRSGRRRGLSSTRRCITSAVCARSARRRTPALTLASSSSDQQSPLGHRGGTEPVRSRACRIPSTTLPVVTTAVPAQWKCLPVVEILTRRRSAFAGGAALPWCLRCCCCCCGVRRFVRKV